MDEQLVLTAQTLRLNPHIQRADMPGGVCVLKNVPARKYLTVTLDQWNLLRNFVNPATVPDILRAVILNRTCRPLREYYELILKAYRAGILQIDRSSEPQVRARQWIVPLHPGVAIALGWGATVAAVAMLILHPFPLPSHWPLGLRDVLFGWILLIGALSAGEALGASVLYWGGGEIYDPRFVFLHPIPHLRINLDDTCMIGRLAHAGVCSAKLFPVMLTAVLLWWQIPEWGTLHAIAVPLMLRPFLGGAVTPVLSAIFRGYLLDTHKNLVFGPNRRWGVRLSFGLERVSAAYVFARLLCGLGWIVLVMTVALHAVGTPLRDVVADIEYWKKVGLTFAALFGVAGLLMMARPALRNLWTSYRARSKQVQRVWQRWRAKPAVPPDSETVSRLLADSLIFRRLPPSERTELLRCAQLRHFKAWQVLHRFSDKPTEIGIVVSGRMTIYRRVKSGRAEPVLALLEGDVFGAHALLDAGRPEAQIRTNTPVVALMIPIEEFQQRVINRIGVSLANDLIQKVPFLRNVSFCRSWHPQAIARFAQLSNIVSYEADEIIVADRQDSHQFFLIYEGRVLVQRENKTLSRLRIGSFFGEIGLLQNSAAVSDVVTREATRCLVITKSDFLRFMTHNPLVGLQLEEISSMRLGHPIFPLSVGSFEVR